ncbi:MAG TPA: endonuclease Q family protein [Halanaerobiales bacterium]|nr:endonuclease Q family protein [Halanaerobiales bacterium]
MNEYFADLHIHIGASKKGEPVKITASKNLTFENIVKESCERKGLDLIGIIDCASPRVQTDIEDMLKNDEIEELPGGGFNYKDKIVIIPGAEVESREENGGMVHYLAYFPFFENLKEFTAIMKQYITNVNLSSQVTGLKGSEILKIVEATGGIMVIAHAFTPHKSFYGNAVDSYKKVFTNKEWGKIPAIELGLSADSNLADRLSELKSKSFLSNSDSHSVPKIAREYNIFKMKGLNFYEFKNTLLRKKGRGVVANFGLDPRLGKYHRSYCTNCNKNFTYEKSYSICPKCGKELIKGVKDRILEISDQKVSHPDHRGKYIYQIPLLDIPGLGKKTLQKLLKKFNTEMEVIHNTKLAELKEVLNVKLAKKIEMARTGNAKIVSGGGGNYGKMK